MKNVNYLGNRSIPACLAVSSHMKWRWQEPSLIQLWEWNEYCQAGQKSSVHVNQTLNENINYRVNGRCDRDLLLINQHLMRNLSPCHPCHKKGICDFWPCNTVLQLLKIWILTRSWLSWYWISYSSRRSPHQEF